MHVHHAALRTPTLVSIVVGAEPELHQPDRAATQLLEHLARGEYTVISILRGVPSVFHVTSPIYISLRNADLACSPST